MFRSRKKNAPRQFSKIGKPMNFRSPQTPNFFLAAMLALLCCIASTNARAADIQVNASLSDPTVEVGQPTELEIKITGSTNTKAPREINVDGLSITYSGNRYEQQMNFGFGSNSGSSVSMIHTYSVIPQRAGKFTIPAQTIEVDGKTFQTKPVVFNVGGSANNGGIGGENQSLAFAEIVMPKQSAFVGEMIPVELRFYVDTRVRWNVSQPPALSGEGFTIQKFAPNAQQNQVNRDGRIFDLVTFKTAVTPVKAGKLTLGPATLEALAQIPRARRQRPRSMFDEPFDDFFNDPFGAFAQQQKMTIKSEPAEIEVKSLPASSQAKTFSGAVGQFQLSTSASPTKVHAGDPITITAKITGRGNFDRAGAPQIADEPGWKSYPPSEKFVADDDVGISGTKTFEMAVIANEKKEKLPLLRWTYFDPAKERFVTLSGEQTPIVVEGAPPPTPAPITNNATQPAAPANSQVAQATPPPSDILYIRTDAGNWGESFEPIYRSRIFWATQLAPMTALLAFLGLRVRQTRRGDIRAQRTLAWRKQKADAWRILHDSEKNDTEFLNAVTHWIQLDVAAKTGREPAFIDAATACASRKLNAETAARIEALFAAQAESRYAGTARGGQVFSPAQREDTLKTLKDFEEADARV